MHRSLLTHCQQGFKFGPWPIASEEVFLTTSYSFAFVNLKPIVPGMRRRGRHHAITRQSQTGHVLVSSKRVVPRFASLSAEEVADLWCAQATVSNLCG